MAVSRSEVSGGTSTGEGLRAAPMSVGIVSSLNSAYWAIRLLSASKAMSTDRALAGHSNRSLIWISSTPRACPFKVRSAAAAASLAPAILSCTTSPAASLSPTSGTIMLSSAATPSPFRSVGRTAGAGIQHAVTPNWSIRAEYRYTAFSFTDTSDQSILRAHHDLEENMVQVGFSYMINTSK
jgi:hypothetical protein